MNTTDTIKKSIEGYMFTIRTDYKTMFSNIVKTAKSYLYKNPNLKSLIVGISGGIDSALVTALASEVIKDLPDIKLIGRSLSIETNTKEEISRSEHIGINFCNHFEERDLTKAYQHLYTSFILENGREKLDTIEEKIRKGNIKARVRMAYLFDLAHFENGMVLSTDNYTELLLGFWTLHGDVGNYGFIQYLWKTEVYGLAGYLVDKYDKAPEKKKAEAVQACIDALPTDGLGITISDFDQIGVDDYESADRILIEYLKNDTKNSDHPVIKRYLGSVHKRLDPQNIPREDIFR